MSAFGIADVKAYLGWQRSDNLNPVYVDIWSTFAKCQPESPGLTWYKKHSLKQVLSTTNILDKKFFAAATFEDL